jgi:hypothetical protein
MRSIALDGGGALWVADNGAIADGAVGPVAFVVGPGATGACVGWSIGAPVAALSPSPLFAGDALLVPLDLVATPGGLGVYYELLVSDSTQPLGLREEGIGLAMGGAAGGPFVSSGELLWSADRPSYGSSALVVGAQAYVYGCRSDAAFSEACFVARADVGALASTAAYAYWSGNGWSSNADEAAPISEGGVTVSVRADPTGAPRYLMTYVPPLGDTLVARTAPAPEGPWSAPATLATCALDGAGANAFCAGGQQHPELSRGGLTVSYDARTFASDARAGGAAFWPRVVEIEVPAGLP